MPKSFSEHEREIIHARLVEAGRQFFATRGMRRTSVEDLTRAAGISKGAFYLFYDVKEELFLEIVEQFEAEYHELLFAWIRKAKGAPRDAFKALLRRAVTEWESNPLFRNFDKEEYAYALRKLPPEKIQAHIHGDDEFAAEFIQRWKQVGVTVQGDPVLVAGLMKSLFFVNLHRADFGAQVYPRTIDVLLEMITGYLVPKHKRSTP